MKQLLFILLNLVLLIESYHYHYHINHYNNQYNKLISTSPIPSTSSTSSSQLYMSSNSIIISEEERLRLRGELLDLCDDYTENQKLKWNGIIHIHIYYTLINNNIY
jgi:hypothetical protein